MMAMFRRLRPRGVRTRITLWYAAAMGLVLLVYSAGIFLIVRWKEYERLDAELLDDCRRVEDMLELDEDGRVQWRTPDYVDFESNGIGYRLYDMPDFPVEGVKRDPREPAGYLALTVWSTKGEILIEKTSLWSMMRHFPRIPFRAEAGAWTAGAWKESKVRSLVMPAEAGGKRVLIRSMRDETGLRRTLLALLVALGLALPLAAGLSALGGWFLSRRVLAPVDRMAARAGRITVESLSERLLVENPDDELGRLATAFNGAFDRIERSFEELRRFTADASHELRTPLAAIRTTGEVALSKPREPEAYRETIGSMLEELERLNRLIDALLTLSRADAGRVKLKLDDELDLGDLAAETTGLLAVLAEEKGQRIEVFAESWALVRADRAVLRQAAINLIDNAIRHGPRGSAIFVRTAASGAEAILAVNDQGPGIAAEHRERIFERFYRVDKARSREQGGAGLGLAIARWAVEAHGGRIELDSEPGRGSTFRIVLPGARAAATEDEA